MVLAVLKLLSLVLDIGMVGNGFLVGGDSLLVFLNAVLQRGIKASEEFVDCLGLH